MALLTTTASGQSPSEKDSEKCGTKLVSARYKIDGEEDMFLPSSEPLSKSKILRTFAVLAIPSAMTTLLDQLSNVVLTVFAGHAEYTIDLAVMGLSVTTCTIMLESLMYGVNTAQETLTS